MATEAQRHRGGRLFLSFLLLLFGSLPLIAAEVPGQILFIPIDDRPATFQFARMIAKVVQRELMTPPKSYLGRFTTPGSTGPISRWLMNAEADRIEGAILSIDMLVYGGLVASRVLGVDAGQAVSRLEVLNEFRRKHPRLRIFAFDTILRLAPTATLQTHSYHDLLARWAELKGSSLSGEGARELAELERKIPAKVLEAYLQTRRRNHEVNKRLLKLVRDGVIDFLVLSQDDAKPSGLHKQEQALLEEEIRRHGIGERVHLYAGADEVSNVLLSRLLLERYRYEPGVNVIYSSEAGGKAVDPYEDRPLFESVRHQLNSSGARLAVGAHGVRPSPAVQGARRAPLRQTALSADYTLFVRVPQTTELEEKRFRREIQASVRSGQPTAVADVAWELVHGGPDPGLIHFLEEEQLAHQLIAFASWNTAGNTLGTVIPHANLHLLLRRRLSDHFDIAHRGLISSLAFLYHRYVNDYGYHDLVRPPLQRFVRDQLKANTIDLENHYPKVNRLVRQKMEQVCRDFFQRNFLGKSFPIPGHSGSQLWIGALKTLNIVLPWPRTFEVQIEFEFATEVHQPR